MPNENEKIEQEREDEISEGEDEEELEASGEDDQEDDNQDDGDDDHPGRFISEALQEIQDQLKRLESRNSGNLKFELVNNVYPIIIKIVEPLLHWMAGIEEELDDLTEDDGEPEVDPEIQKAMEEGTKKLLNTCEKITKLEENPTDPVLMKEVASWAKETLATAKQAQTVQK